MQRLLLFLFILVLPLWSAFQPSTLPEEVEEMVQKRIQEKVEDFKKKRRKACWDKAISVASDIVDSLLMIEIKAIQMDSTGRPVKPVKPPMPEIKKMEDTLPVRPLLPIDSLEKQDSSDQR